MTLSNSLDGDSELLRIATERHGLAYRVNDRVRLFWNGAALGLHLMQIFHNLFPCFSVKQQQLLISLLFEKVFRALQCISYICRSNPSAGRFSIVLCNPPARGSAPGSRSPGCEQRTAPAAADSCCESGNCSRITLGCVSASHTRTWHQFSFKCDPEI